MTLDQFYVDQYSMDQYSYGSIVLDQSSVDQYFGHRLPERGLKEGCPTSPCLFIVFHLAVMRRAETARREAAEARGVPVGQSTDDNQEMLFPAKNLWENYCSEAEGKIVSLSLFANDTTVVGRKEEIDEGVREMKKIMSKFEEKNNDNKEERLVICSYLQDWLFARPLICNVIFIKNNWHTLLCVFGKVLQVQNR